MNSLRHQLNRRLSKLYDELSKELQFNLSLSDLIAENDVWHTDILQHLRRACRYLLMADGCKLNRTEQVSQSLQAELTVRHLIESLIYEFTEYYFQVELLQQPAEDIKVKTNLYPPS